MTTLAATGARPSTGGLQASRAVPWLTVIPLAVVMDYADGFWVTSLRGAVGAVSRTGHPFATWFRESTLTLPVFVIAAMAGLMLAARWFGPEVRKPARMVATLAVVAVAGTVAGVAQLAANAVYDYHLQIQQLDHMSNMGTVCVGACTSEQVQATLNLQVKAVAMGAGILLVTNLVAVAWAVALRGGRINLGRGSLAGRARARSASRWHDGAQLLAVVLLGAAVIHAAVVPQQLAEWRPAGVLLLLLMLAEGGVAGWLLARATPVALSASLTLSVAALTVWAWSRTVGLPVGPEAGVPTEVGVADAIVVALEVAAVALAVVLVASRSLRARPPASLQLTRMTAAVVVAVTVLGLTGSGLSWFDGAIGSGTSTTQR